MRSISTISNRNAATSRWLAYSQSKLARLMFAFELQRRSDGAGWGIQSIAAHPGISRTDLLPNGAGAWSGAGIARRFLWFLFQPARAGRVTDALRRNFDAGTRRLTTARTSLAKPEAIPPLPKSLRRHWMRRRCQTMDRVATCWTQLIHETVIAWPGLVQLSAASRVNMTRRQVDCHVAVGPADRSALVIESRARRPALFGH